MPAHVILCGADQTLLNTRQAVLRSVGFDALTATRLEEIEALIQARIVDALVIGHTFKPEQQKAALAILHHYRPNAKSIILTISTTREINAQPDAFVSTAEGPKILIQTLDRLLNHA